MITATGYVIHSWRYLSVKRVVLFEGDTDINHFITKCHNRVYATLDILESLRTLVLGLLYNEWTICCLAEKRRMHVRNPLHDMSGLEMVKSR